MMTRMTSARWVGTLGLALLLAGLAKAWSTAAATGKMMFIGCGGEMFALPVAQSAPSLMHCWGCYSAIAGALMLAALALKTVRPLRP